MMRYVAQCFVLFYTKQAEYRLWLKKSATLPIMKFEVADTIGGKPNEYVIIPYDR